MERSKKRELIKNFYPSEESTPSYVQCNPLHKRKTSNKPKFLFHIPKTFSEKNKIISEKVLKIWSIMFKQKQESI